MKPEFDGSGRVTSYGIPDGYPRNSQIVAELVEMGYPRTAENGFQAWVRTDGWTFVGSDFRKQGRLFVVDGVNDLDLLDMSDGGEGDLLDPGHLKLSAFQKARDEGRDGVIISDFCQTAIYGNVGHRSIGVFADAVTRLRHWSVPAVNWEWPEDGHCVERTTPDFELAHSQARVALVQMAPSPSVRP